MGVWCRDSGWANNNVHGRGSFFFAEQKARYTGQFRNNKKHGPGIYVWGTGNRSDNQTAARMTD